METRRSDITSGWERYLRLLRRICLACKFLEGHSDASLSMPFRSMPIDQNRSPGTANGLGQFDLLTTRGFDRYCMGTVN